MLEAIQNLLFPGRRRRKSLTSSTEDLGDTAAAAAAEGYAPLLSASEDRLQQGRKPNYGAHAEAHGGLQVEAEHVPELWEGVTRDKLGVPTVWKDTVIRLQEEEVIHPSTSGDTDDDQKKKKGKRRKKGRETRLILTGQGVSLWKEKAFPFTLTGVWERTEETGEDGVRTIIQGYFRKFHRGMEDRPQHALRYRFRLSRRRDGGGLQMMISCSEARGALAPIVQE